MALYPHLSAKAVAVSGYSFSWINVLLAATLVGGVLYFKPFLWQKRISLKASNNPQAKQLMADFGTVLNDNEIVIAYMYYCTYQSVAEVPDWLNVQTNMLIEKYYNSDGAKPVFTPANNPYSVY